MAKKHGGDPNHLLEPNELSMESAMVLVHPFSNGVMGPYVDIQSHLKSAVYLQQSCKKNPLTHLTMYLPGYQGKVYDSPQICSKHEMDPMVVRHPTVIRKFLRILWVYIHPYYPRCSMYGIFWG